MDNGILEFKGSGGESSISKADTKGMAKVRKMETVALGEGGTDEIPAGSGIYEECARDTVNCHSDGEQLLRIITGSGRVQRENHRVTRVNKIWSRRNGITLWRASGGGGRGVGLGSRVKGRRRFRVIRGFRLPSWDW